MSSAEQKRGRRPACDGRLILASASPRRRELLADAGYEFVAMPPPIPEPEEDWDRLGPAELAESLAYFKARSVQQVHPEDWVLGADTVVALEGRTLGKAPGPREAADMLRRLGGTRHAVITGVALLAPGGRRLIASDTTYVTMRRMTEQEVEQYAASGEWEGKAGAYAIQETADRFVVKLEGSRTNVVGLPMELVERMWKRMNCSGPGGSEG